MLFAESEVVELKAEIVETFARKSLRLLTQKAALCILVLVMTEISWA